MAKTPAKPKADPKVEDLPKEGGEVTTTETTTLVAQDGPDFGQMEADAPSSQVFDRSQLIIPRLILLQDLSPQVKERDPDYVKDAKPGLWYLPLTKGLSVKVDFVPSRFTVRYLAWQPRPVGGLVGIIDDLSEVEENFTQVGMGQWEGMMAPRKGEAAVKVEISETPEWIGLCRGSQWDWLPCVISFPGTKAKTARAMNTTITLTKIVGKTGNKFTPPSFYHEFGLTSGLESRGEDEWFAPRADRTGWCLDQQVVAEAKQLSASVQSGHAVADDNIETAI